MLAALLLAALTGPGDAAPCDPATDPNCDGMIARVIPCPIGVVNCRTLAVVPCPHGVEDCRSAEAVALVPCPEGRHDCYTVVPCPIGVVDCYTLAPCEQGEDCYALAPAGPLVPVADPMFSRTASANAE